jgi:hypothetical protein
LLNLDQRYRIGVNYARHRETETSDATVVVLVDGQEAGRWTQTLTEQGMYWVPTLIEGSAELVEP